MKEEKGKRRSRRGEGGGEGGRENKKWRSEGERGEKVKQYS